MFDNLGFWYWRLQDKYRIRTNFDFDPDTAYEMHEINYFMGGRILSAEEGEKRPNLWLREPEDCRHSENNSLYLCKESNAEFKVGK